MSIQTVRGPVPAGELGVALPHEHVLCDFVGAAQTDPARWSADEVVAAVEPNLRELVSRGVRTLVDCTPAFIGRDPGILRRLADRTGLNIVTNTGYYGGADDLFVPAHAYDESAEQLADRWVAEARDGIGDTGICPGFIKTGVDEITGSVLSPIDDRLVRAAALASRVTGLSVTCHTGGGAAGLAAVRTFVDAGGDPGRFVVAHSDGHGPEINEQVARLGAWVSFDAVGRQPLSEHLPVVLALVQRHPDRVLLSHDSGWYAVGEPDGGEIRGYTALSDEFVPALRTAGVSDDLVRRLIETNPAAVLEVGTPT